MRKVNAATVELIKEFEGLRLKAYLDSVGIPTIGYGHTASVKMGTTCTKEQAEAWLLSDLQYAQSALEKVVKVALNDNQYGALVSLVFNVGPGSKDRDGICMLRSGQPSSLIRQLNEGRYDTAPMNIRRWNRAGGVVDAGLVRRRDREAELFVSKPPV